MSEYRVQFEVFEGPLDLLLHLVKKQEVDIYQVNLTRIATEFVAYIGQMRELDLEVAGEFVVMASTLVYIKSRELLPVEKQAIVEEDDSDDEDPRWELIRRLVEYKKFKDAAAQLQEQEARMDSVYEHRPGRFELPVEPEAARAPVSVFDLVHAVSTILKRFGERGDVREIEADPHTVSDRIDFIRQLVMTRSRFRFGELFDAAKSRAEVVVTFLAVLELIRLKFLVAVQTDEFGEIDIEPAPCAPASAPNSIGVPVSDSVEPSPSVLPPADIVPPPAQNESGSLPSAVPIAESPDESSHA